MRDAGATSLRSLRKEDKVGLCDSGVLSTVEAVPLLPSSQRCSSMEGMASSTQLTVPRDVHGPESPTERRACEHAPRPFSCVSAQWLRSSPEASLEAIEPAGQNEKPRPSAKLSPRTAASR